jgi:hypothetical protein
MVTLKIMNTPIRSLHNYKFCVQICVYRNVRYF